MSGSSRSAIISRTLSPELVDDVEGLDPHAVVLGQRRDAVLQLGVEAEDGRRRRRLAMMTSFFVTSPTSVDTISS